MQLKTYGLTDLVLNTQCQYGWASIKLNNTVLTHLSASQQEYPQYLFQDVMSDISSKDGEDFKKPKDVNGSDGDNLSVAGHLTITLRTAVFTEIAILSRQAHLQTQVIVLAITVALLKVALVTH